MSNEDDFKNMGVLEENKDEYKDMATELFGSLLAVFFIGALITVLFGLVALAGALWLLDWFGVLFLVVAL